MVMAPTRVVVPRPIVRVIIVDDDGKEEVWQWVWSETCLCSCLSELHQFQLHFSEKRNCSGLCVQRCHDNQQHHC